MSSFFFFFNDTATTEIYTLSLHDALPISPELSTPEASSSVERSAKSRPVSVRRKRNVANMTKNEAAIRVWTKCRKRIDRKSTRLNSSHLVISYAVFCLKKKKKTHTRLLAL